MFEHFDFSILGDPEFKEDAVREELIVPILNRLGYAATGAHRITRSKSLVHPFVYIGTKAYKVNIFSDYLLSVDGSVGWVLDAKGPSEAIGTGRHVEQAYSYAIHPDVRASIYALCNGHVLAVFHISQVAPILEVPLTEIDAQWDEVNNVLCPMAFIDPERLDFLPDYGLAMLRIGGASFETISFPWVPVHFISKLSDDLYALTSQFDLGREYCATFDLDPPKYQNLLTKLSESDRGRITSALSRQPYQVVFSDDSLALSIKARLENTVVSNAREDYVPFIVLEVTVSPLSAKDMLALSPYDDT
jgi:Type I restriction enzyme R protein N terminus (HSDR_N)